MTDPIQQLRPTALLEEPETPARPAPTLSLEQREVVRTRLLWMSALLGALFLVAVVVTVIMNNVAGTPLARYRVSLLLIAALAVMCGVVFWVVRRVGSEALSYVGFAFEVLLCLLMSYSTTGSVYRATGYVDETNWIIGFIILFPLVVPARPLHTMMAALASAGTAPLSLWLLGETDGLSFTAFQYVNVSLSPLFAVVVATLSSRVVYGMHLDVARARRLGSYQLLERLGVGGMGEVWRAEHRLLARPAAVKIIKPAALGGDGKNAQTVLDRFAREARTTALLRSPHTVEVFDFGFTAEGEFYYVMELLDGVDLHSLVTEYGPVPVPRAIHLLCQACHSLQEAHAANLVHRDIKPANLFMCRYGSDADFLKVLDFGLVKRQRADGSGVDLTGENTVVGTPAFIAPELVLGDGIIDGRADLYALGCVAYWLVTGQLVFQEDNAMRAVVAHATKAPVPPSQLSELEIPPGFDEVVMACLSKSPGDRPQTADELREQLTALDVAPWSAEDARGWWIARSPLRAPNRIAEHE